MKNNILQNAQGHDQAIRHPARIEVSKSSIATIKNVLEDDLRIRESRNSVPMNRGIRQTSASVSIFVVLLLTIVEPEISKLFKAASATSVTYMPVVKQVLVDGTIGSSLKCRWLSRCLLVE